TVPDQAAVDAAVAEMVGAGGLPGDTFTLTTGVDALVGTLNNDTFQAILDGGATDTINTFDSIDGNAGSDTLLIVGAGGVALPGSVTVKNVEVVNVATSVTNLASSSFQGINQLWQIGFAEAVTIGAGVTAGFRDVLVGANNVIAEDGVSS